MQPDFMPTSRSVVYEAIDSERAYQDAAQGNALRLAPHAGEPLTSGEIILCIEKCIADARNEWYKPGGSTTAMPYLRKAAALAVQAMERYGAPRREGF